MFYVTRFQWNNMPQQDKVHLKDCTMEMLTNVSRVARSPLTHAKRSESCPELLVVFNVLIKILGDHTVAQN